MSCMTPTVMKEPLVDSVNKDSIMSEACKVLENTYRAVNIALVNELKVLFDKTEALLGSETLERAVVGSFTDLLPSSKSILFRDCY